MANGASICASNGNSLDTEPSPTMAWLFRRLAPRIRRR